jgi:molecular chaperone Hsp33
VSRVATTPLRLTRVTQVTPDAMAQSLAGRCAYVAARAKLPVASKAARVTSRRNAMVPAAVSRIGVARNSSAARGSRTATKASADDLIYRVMSANQEVSVISVVGTKVVADAVSRHKTAPTASAALGRSMLSAILLGTFKGDDENTQVTFKGDGPIGQIIAISDNTGQVKGMVSNPNADPPLRPDGKLNVGAAVGQGFLTVARSHPSWKAPFTGTVQIASGEIAEDIAVYLQDSEQVNSAVAVGVSLDRDLNVRSAGGYMVQVLPFASDETIEKLERSITSLKSTTDMIADGLSAKEMAEKVLGELGSLPEVAAESVPSYGPCCRDDLRGRMMRALASMGKKEVDSIIEEQGQVEMTCEFCKESIVFKEDDLSAASQEI